MLRCIYPLPQPLLNTRAPPSACKISPETESSPGYRPVWHTGSYPCSHKLDYVSGFHGMGVGGGGEHFTFLHTDGFITWDPAQGSVQMFHTQSLCRALQLESILAVKSGDGAFKENPSAGRPEAILRDAWVSTHLKVIEPYMDREKKRCL